MYILNKEINNITYYAYTYYAYTYYAYTYYAYTYYAYTYYAYTYYAYTTCLRALVRVHCITLTLQCLFCCVDFFFHFCLCLRLKIGQAKTGPVGLLPPGPYSTSYIMNDAVMGS